jgi:hypothetical protein
MSCLVNGYQSVVRCYPFDTAVRCLIGHAAGHGEGCIESADHAETMMGVAGQLT